MNNDIKEILDYFRKYATIRENTMITEIEDYITKLEQENKKFKNWINALNKDNHNYKSKIDKALKALHNSKEYKVMKELEFNKNMSILIKLDKLLGGDE